MNPTWSSMWIALSSLRSIELFSEWREESFEAFLRVCVAFQFDSWGVVEEIWRL